MLRLAFFLVVPAFVGCVSAPADERFVGETPELSSRALPERHFAVSEPSALELDLAALPPAGSEPLPIVADPEPAVSIEPLDPALLAPIAQDEDESLHNSRFTIKGGLYTADAEEISDDGWIVNASWMRFFTRALALELEIGYFDASGEDGGLEADVWGIPVMVNGRVNLPLWILDIYGGVGAGTIYYDAEAEFLGLTAEDDGFLLAGNVFLGGTVNVGDAVALGVEGKYYVTEEIDDVDEPLDAFALMLTLGFSR